MQKVPHDMAGTWSYV